MPSFRNEKIFIIEWTKENIFAGQNLSNIRQQAASVFFFFKYLIAIEA
jgi:hypothetical protein